MSAADLMAVLLDGHLRLDFGPARRPGQRPPDLLQGARLAALLRLLKAAGAIDDEELLTFRKLGSRLEGHPTPQLPWVDVATGSLGQGLPIGVGHRARAQAARPRRPARVWVLCGDSELAEGSIWEAFDHASFCGPRQPDRDRRRQPARADRRDDAGWDLDVYAARARAFGWEAIEMDGHDVEEIERAYAAGASDDRQAHAS